MTSKLKHILWTLTAAAAAVASHAAAVDDTAADKAGYIYMEALRQNALGNTDAFYELMRHALATDSGNTAAAYYVGYNDLMMDNATIDQAVNGARLMRKHFDAHPDDYYEAYTYGRVVTSLGQREEGIRVWDTLAAIFPHKLDVLGEQADSYARNGDFRKAIQLYDSIEAAMGQIMEVSFRKLAFYNHLSDTLGLLTEARKLLQSAPRNAEFNLIMGQVMANTGMGDSAMAYYDRAIEYAPDDGRPYMSKAEYYLLRGDSANYENQIYSALTSRGLEVEAKVEVLTQYIRQRLARQDSTQRVHQLFEVLIDQHPHEPQIRSLYSQYFVALAQYSQAAEQLQYVVALDPAEPENWKRLIMVNMADQNYPAAIAAAEQALEYNPNDFELYLYVGPAYYQMKEYDRALDLYQQCLEKVPSDNRDILSDVYGGIGDVYYALGDTLHAFSSYEASLSYNPSNIMVMNNYAYFLAEEGVKLDKAESMSALAVKGDPDSPTYLDTYAWVFFKKGEYSLALAYIEYAISSSGTTPSFELWEHYGDILFMSGQFDKAVECWEKAYELNPDSEILQKKVTHKTYFRPTAP